MQAIYHSAVETDRLTCLPSLRRLCFLYHSFLGLFSLPILCTPISKEPQVLSPSAAAPQVHVYLLLLTTLDDSLTTAEEAGDSSTTTAPILSYTTCPLPWRSFR